MLAEVVKADTVNLVLLTNHVRFMRIVIGHHSGGHASCTVTSL